MGRPKDDVRPPRIFSILRHAHTDRKFKVGINASFLKDLSEAIGTEQIVLEISKPDQAILVKPVRGEDGSVGRIMPVRIK